MISDECLERNRRVAWARYYQERANKVQIALWAAELAEYLDRLADDLPPAAVELMEIVREAVSPVMRVHISRSVHWNIREHAAAVA